jgi:Leucine-rich repeat (LRR) protein
MKHLKTYKNGVTFKEWIEDNLKSFNSIRIVCRNCELIDLDGIEKFEDLKHIDCSNNKIEKLPDLSKLKNLIFINCSNNKLTQLPDLSNLSNLEFLYCDNNDLPFKCLNYNDNLDEYLEWHKKEFPYIWDAKKYNI